MIAGVAVFTRLALTAATLLAGASRASAAAPFDTSTLTLAGAAPSEGALFTYTLVLRNSGQTIGGVVEIAIPRAAMLVQIDGLDGAMVDHDARLIHWEGELPPGASRTCTLSLVAGLDAGGTIASLRVTARPWQGETTYLQHGEAVDSVPATAVLRVGSIGVTKAGAAVLGWLAAAVLFWLVMGVWRPRDALWAPVSIMLPAGFLLYFLVLAREDARILALPETACVVLDRVVDSRVTSSSSSSTPRRTGPQTVYAPRLALRYSDSNGARVAQGFGTDSRLSGNSAASAQALLTRYAVGARVSCAVDARDPRRAYVERGYGGAYGFALIPLPVLVLGVWGLRSRRPGAS